MEYQSAISRQTKTRSTSNDFLSRVLAPPVVSSKSATLSSNPINILITKFAAAGPSSSSVSSRLSKLSSIEVKILKAYDNFLKELNLWISSLSDEESRKLIVEFYKCIEVERNIKETMLLKKQELSNAFASVYDREKKVQDLRYSRDKEEYKLNFMDNKSGNTKKISLIKEKIERILGSLEVAEEQLNNIINSELRNVYQRYLEAHNSISIELGQSVRHSTSSYRKSAAESSATYASHYYNYTPQTITTNYENKRPENISSDKNSIIYQSDKIYESYQNPKLDLENSVKNDSSNRQLGVASHSIDNQMKRANDLIPIMETTIGATSLEMNKEWD